MDCGRDVQRPHQRDRNDFQAVLTSLTSDLIDSSHHLSDRKGKLVDQQ